MIIHFHYTKLIHFANDILSSTKKSNRVQVVTFSNGILLISQNKVCCFRSIQKHTDTLL